MCQQTDPSVVVGGTLLYFILFFGGILGANNNALSELRIHLSGVSELILWVTVVGNGNSYST